MNTKGDRLTKWLIGLLYPMAAVALISTCGNGNPLSGGRAKQPRPDSTTVVDGAVNLPPGFSHTAYPFDVTEEMTHAHLVGWFNSSGSISGDMNVFVASAAGYENWSADRGCVPKPLYSTGMTSRMAFDVPIQSPGKYDVVYDNKMNALSKEVTTRVVLLYYVTR